MPAVSMTPLAGRAGACLQPQPGRRWPSVRATVRCGAQQNFMEDPGTQPSTSGGSEAADAEEQRRHFYSSLATLGLGASLLSERLNGAGLVQQLELAEGNMFVDPLIWLVTGGLLVAALYPSSRPQAEHGAADAGTVDVQNLAGRISFLGLATTLAAEMITGKGLLALLHVDTGVELSEVEGILAFLVMLILTGPHKHVNPRT